MIYFPVPAQDHRKKLWSQAFSSKFVMEAELDLTEIAKKHEMAGGAITNVARYCSLMALKRGSSEILKKDLLKGIRKEFAKEGKTIL